MKIQRTFCYTTTDTEALNLILLNLIKDHDVEIQQVIRTSSFSLHPSCKSKDTASYIILALVESKPKLRSIPNVPKDERSQMQEGSDKVSIIPSDQNTFNESLKDSKENNILKRIKKVLEETIFTYEENFSIDDDIFEVFEMDSLDQVELIMILEKEFDITISDTVAADLLKKSKTLRKIAEYINFATEDGEEK